MIVWLILSQSQIFDDNRERILYMYIVRKKDVRYYL